MAILELRDPELARQHLLAGLWLARVAAPAAQTIPLALDWLFCLASDGHVAPPIGFLMDVGLLALGTYEARPPIAARELPGIDPGLVRRYEDYVLGKLYADLAFERGADAILGYEPGDRSRGVAYLIERMLAQTGFEGIHFNPAAIRSLQQIPPAELLQESWQSLTRDGLTEFALQQYEELIERVRSTGDLLASADVFELEHGSALAQFGQRLALRQTLDAAEQLAAGLPRERPRAASRHRQAATRLLDEDAYPVGGFSSISTKGSIESLLHSQLVFMDRGERPDLFDMKFVRDELLYYSRDENQFLRRRTTLFVVFAPDLVRAHVKDQGLPYQRIVLALGLVLALVRKLTDWLHDEALDLQFVFVPRQGVEPLTDERALVELLLSEELARGVAHVEQLSRDKLLASLLKQSRKSAVQCLVLAAGDWPLVSPAAQVTHLALATSEPAVSGDDEAYFSEQSGLDAWRDVLRHLLERLL